MLSFFHIFISLFFSFIVNLFEVLWYLHIEIFSLFCSGCTSQHSSSIHSQYLCYFLLYLIFYRHLCSNLVNSVPQHFFNSIFIIIYIRLKIKQYHHYLKEIMKDETDLIYHPLYHCYSDQFSYYSFKSVLQFGHTDFLSSQGTMQTSWNICLHFSTLITSPFVNPITQILHYLSDFPILIFFILSICLPKPNNCF